MSSDNSALVISRSLSISSKILNKTEKIIIIIKAMVVSNKEDVLAKLNRLLYRAMDNLTEFELELLQLQVTTKNTCTNTFVLFLVLQLMQNMRCVFVRYRHA